MAERTCELEARVLDCAATGELGQDLRDHVAGCACCRDLFEAACAVLYDRNELVREANLPSAGLVWWRTRMRAEREAARAAVRAASFIQVLLIATAILIAVAFLGISIDFRAVAASIAASAGKVVLPTLAIAAWLLLGSVAVYFVVTER